MHFEKSQKSSTISFFCLFEFAVMLRALCNFGEIYCISGSGSISSIFFIEVPDDEMVAGLFTDTVFYPVGESRCYITVFLYRLYI